MSDSETAGGLQALTPLPANLDEAFVRMESRTNLEKGIPLGNPNRVYRLDRMRALCEAFDNPQDAIPTIHIAGSKGKGSTGAYVAALLASKGKKVGVYSSPHLMDYRERFQIQNEPFPEERALESASALLERLPFIEEGLPGEGGATTFELLTLFAFLFFRNTGCNYIVLETGLGGRLDATNVISCPEIVLITPIEREHTEILGNQLRKIAAEKAGIMKNGIPVLSAKQKYRVRQKLCRHAGSKNAPISFLDEKRIQIKAMKEDSGTGSVGKTLFPWLLSWQAKRSSGNKAVSEERLSLAMGGRVQAENAALALAALRTLGFKIPSESLPEVLSSVRLPGRFHFLQENPPILIDGAHTTRSSNALAESFATLAGPHPVLLFGSVLGKNHKAMARRLCGGRRPLFREVIVSTPGFFKPSDPESVARSFRQTGADTRLIPNPEEAWQAVLKTAAGKKAILVTGSFFMAGEIARWQYKEKESPLL